MENKTKEIHMKIVFDNLDEIKKQIEELGQAIEVPKFSVEKSGIKQKEETCQNLSEYDSCDQLECSYCGVVIEGYSRIEFDEDNPGDKYHYEYRPNYCPNCGRRIID
ncbi:MAG: hypothetical protein ACLUHF_06770 [Faecalitalea cylindroides]